MNPPFQKIKYSKLSPKRQESYNFQKISAILADYGFTTILLNDDWNGADFLALHKDGETLETLKVQLKSRITFAAKYQKKDLWIAAPVKEQGGWYLYPHDEAIRLIEAAVHFQHSDSWRNDKLYSWPSPSSDLLGALSPYFLKG